MKISPLLSTGALSLTLTATSTSVLSAQDLKPFETGSSGDFINLQDGIYTPSYRPYDEKLNFTQYAKYHPNLLLNSSDWDIVVNKAKKHIVEQRPDFFEDYVPLESIICVEEGYKNLQKITTAPFGWLRLHLFDKLHHLFSPQ